MHKVKLDQFTAKQQSHNRQIGTLWYCIFFYKLFQRNTNILEAVLYVFALIQQLRIPIYLLTLHYEELRWEELPYITSKLNNPGLSDEKLKNLSYQERCNLLNKKFVLAPKHFQHKVEILFKDTILVSQS